MATRTYASSVRGSDPWDSNHRQNSVNLWRTVEGQSGAVEEVEAKIHESQRQPTRPHPTKAIPNETLPEGYARSYSGLLLRGGSREIMVDQAVIKQEMAYLQDHVAIASFVGGKPQEQQLTKWIGALQQQVGGTVKFGHNLGRGFFTLKTAASSTVRELLLLTPQRSHLGLCIFQRWTPGFDPEAERGIANDRSGNGLVIPTWHTLRNLKGEFRGVARQIAEGLGEYLGEDKGNTDSNDPRYCIGLPSGVGWEPSVIVPNEHTGQKIKVIIDYCYLPIRCKYCLSTEHCLRDCNTRPGSRSRTPQQAPTSTRPAPSTSGQERSMEWSVATRRRSTRPPPNLPACPEGIIEAEDKPTQQMPMTTSDIIDTNFDAHKAPQDLPDARNPEEFSLDSPPPSPAKTTSGVQQFAPVPNLNVDTCIFEMPPRNLRSSDADLGCPIHTPVVCSGDDTTPSDSLREDSLAPSPRKLMDGAASPSESAHDIENSDVICTTRSFGILPTPAVCSGDVDTQPPRIGPPRLCKLNGPGRALTLATGTARSRRPPEPKTKDPRLGNDPPPIALANSFSLLSPDN